MSTRTYLFADFGRGPVCFARAERVGNGFTHDAGRASRRLPKACRWWVVECESADAGRRVIAASSGLLRPTWELDGVGRVLASGGQ